LTICFVDTGKWIEIEWAWRNWSIWRLAKWADVRYYVIIAMLLMASLMDVVNGR
jgi:hypothetical protein